MICCIQGYPKDFCSFRCLMLSCRPYTEFLTAKFFTFIFAVLRSRVQDCGSNIDVGQSHDNNFLQVAYNNYFACGHNNSQCKRRLVAFPGIRNIISYRSPVVENFLLKFLSFRYHGNMGWTETNFAYTVKFADIENSLTGARIRNISPIEAQLQPIFC